MKRRNIFTILISVLSIFAAHHGIAGTPNNLHVERISKNTHLNKNIVELALKAHRYAEKQGVVKKDILTIVNYAQPSTEKRLYVIDLKTDQLLFNSRVSHGKKSGLLNSVNFSNEVGSNESSLGVFVTTHPFMDQVGLSLGISGLEKGINDNAQRRNVVIHGSDKMAEEFLNTHGYSGLSKGCLMVQKFELNKLISLTQGGSVIFSYAPAEENDLNLNKIKLF